ncbi:centrosome-associated protein 350 isoform X2 [Phyllopteryx taeniolatus]|uniref:centrosome-associated protein 350 isoform X2 n=1 Tax=Phyllopteryx taeniolatus TaxID=161469 RepID=UPI002AD527BA|nr:centrosome-associated protein 350 isoform X2 [Phyllopteryx taeniolatus]
MGEMRSSKRALPLGVTVHQHTDHNIDTDLPTAWKSLPQSKAALRRIENHVEAVPGTTALLLSVMDPPKKKLSVSVRSRDETRGSSKSKEHRRSSSKKRRSRSPLRNTTQDSNVSQHNSMALREQLSSYRETAPPSPPSFELEAYWLQSMSGPLSPSSDALFRKPVYQKDISDKGTDGHQDITRSGDCTEVCYLNDQPTVDTLQTYANPSHATSSVPAIENSSPEAQITLSVDIQKSRTFLPPASDLICRWESTPSTSPGSDSQRLENLRRHQPDEKLEKLKERIRKQVKHQEETAEKEKVLSRLEQPLMATKCNNGGTTAKVRKVAAAPQAPTYKGFSKTETRTRTPRGNALKDETLHSLNRDTCKDRSKQFAESSPPRLLRERHRSVERENKPTRKIHKAASGKNAKTVITPASWREGLKLVNKVLGTAPKKPREKRHQLDDKPQQTASHWRSNIGGSEANHQSHPTSTDRNHCEFQGQSKSHSTSLSSPSSAGPDKCPVPSRKDLLSADIQAIFDDPRLECRASEEGERSRPRSGKGKGSQRGNARSLSQTRTPLSFSGITVPTYGTSRGCRSANPSPDRPESTNVAQEKRRHYDSDKIRQYIVKQKEARKRRQAEEKKSLKEESDKRNQRLQELYRRQKEMAKTVVTPTEATATPWQNRYREETYNLLRMDETHLEEAIQMQSSVASNQLRPMYQPSGESDKENKKMDLPQSPSSSDRSLTDQLSPQLARGDLDIGVTSRLNPDLSPAVQSLSASSTGALECTSYGPLLSRPLMLENTVEAGNVKPAHAETPTWSQSRRSRIDALKATAISLSNRIESEARQIARVGINYGEATSLETDILAPRSTWADLDERGLAPGHGTFENNDLTSRIQKLITSAGLIPYNSASLSGAGNLHTFKGQPQQITADRTEYSSNSYRLDRNQVNGLEGADDMPHIRPYRPAEGNRENRTDLHDSSGGSISEGTILSEGSFSKDEVSPPHPANNHVLRLTDRSNGCAGQRIEVQHLTDFQKEAAKCLALTSPLAPQNSSKTPWEELNKGDPFSVINIYLKNLNVKVNDRNSPSACSLSSGDSHRDAAVYEDDFVSFHSSGVSQQSKNSCSPHSVGMESKKSPPSQGRLASPSAFPDLGLLQATSSLKNDSRKNGKLHYSPTALQQYMAAELKYQESIDESLRQLGDVERLIGLPVAQQAKQPKSPPLRACMTPDSSPAADFCSELPKNGFSVGPSNSSRATGNLQYSPAILHQHVTAELQYQESIDESLKHLGDVERLMGVSMAQQENASLVQILKVKQQKYDNDLYEQKIQAERKALEAQLQREEDRQRTARAHEELLEKLVLTQKETAEAARHIKELTDLARTQIEGALAVSVVVPESLVLSKHQREKQKSDSESFQREEESSQSLSHTDSRPVQRPNLIGADASCPNTTSSTSTDHINEVNIEETELIWKKEDDKRAQGEAGSNSIEEGCPTADNDSICSESIPSVADDKEYSFKFDSSRTEDEVEECSFSSLLPSKVHRGSSLENRPQHHEDSEDEAADDSTTVVSVSHHVTKNQNPNLAFSSGQDSFSRFTMGMVRQHMKDEDLRLQHQNALLRLRQKAVKEKIRTELAWLEHQKKQLRNKGEDDKLPPIRKKQKGLLLRLQEEQAEIRRLQEANKAARKEKQLLLKQQEEIERMRTSTQRLKERLKSAGCEVPSETPVSETPVSEAAAHNMRSPDDSRTPSPSPSISASETSSIMQKLKKMRSHMDEKHCSPVHCFFSVFTAQHWASLSVCLPNLHPKFQLFIYKQLDRFLTKREQQLMHRRHHAEELLQWKKRLDQEEAEVRRIEKEALASWREGGIISQSRSKAILIPKSSHHRNSEPRAVSEKEYMTEDDYSSATSECSIHTEGHFQEPKSPSSAQTSSVAEITLASNPSSPTNYIDDFASLTLSKQSSPVKGSHKRVSPSDISSVSKTQLHSSFQISKQEPNRLVEKPISSQTEPISEQSDIEIRIKALKEELRKRKYMASQLKREQKMRHKERLKAQEASLLKQLASYDNYIGKTKAELNKDPEPMPRKKDYTLVVDQSRLLSPIKRSETSEIPTVGLRSSSSFHQSHNRSTSASEELNVEAMAPSSVRGGPDFLTSGQEMGQSPDSLGPSAEDAKSQIIESEKDDTVLDSHSAVADLIAHSDKPPSIDHSCRQDLDVISSVKEAPIRDVQASPLTDYQDDFESSVPSSPRKEHISKPDSVCHTEIQFASQDEAIEEEIAEDLSHCSVASGASHESSRLLDFLQGAEDFNNDSHSINSISPAPISISHSPLSLTIDEMPSFNIGDRVLVGNVQPGTLRFKGPTSFAGGFWAGVALDKSEGSNCGTYNGVVYFECKERHGIFAPPEKIIHLSNNFELFTDAAGHDELYSDDVSDQCEDEQKSKEDISENIQILEKSEEPSHNDVLVEFTNVAANLERNLNGQELLKAEIHLDSQHHDQSIPQNGQEITSIVNKENVVDQYLPPISQEIAKVENDNSLDQSTLTNSQEISSIAENDNGLDQHLPLYSQEISAVVEKEEVGPDNELIFSGVSHVAGDHKDVQKDQISPDTLADKLLSTFVIDTVQHLVQIKRAKEQKIEASNQINGGIIVQSEEQGFISLLEPHDGLSSFIPEEEPSSPELCNRPESPILGASGQEELAKRLAELELNRDLLEELGDDQDWFDEDFGLTSRREQQKLQQKQRAEEKRLGAELGRSGSSSEDPLRGLVSHPDGDQSVKTPPRPALPLPPKLPEQPAMVVPHSAGEVEKMVHATIQEIWESCGLTKEGSGSLSLMACCKPSQEFLGVENGTKDLEALSIRSYKQAVYDLTREILQEIYAEDPNANQPEWVKPQRVRSAFSHRLKTPGDINKVLEFVTEEVLKLYGFKNKSKKSDWQKMLKFGRKKRDRVDQILVQELHEEEGQWVCYEEDELSVKMQLADSIFDMLLKDTANSLSLLTKRAAIS